MRTDILHLKEERFEPIINAHLSKTIGVDIGNKQIAVITHKSNCRKRTSGAPIEKNVNTPTHDPGSAEIGTEIFEGDAVEIGSEQSCYEIKPRDPIQSI